MKIKFFLLKLKHRWNQYTNYNEINYIESGYINVLVFLMYKIIIIKI